MNKQSWCILFAVLFCLLFVNIAKSQTIVNSGIWGLHHYYVIDDVDDNSWDWYDATDRIHSLLGPEYHLATITSQEEQDFIGDLIFNTPEQFYYLGGYQDPTGLARWTTPAQQAWEDWNWVTGEKWDYTNWNTLNITEPNDAGIESFLQIYSWLYDSNGNTLDIQPWNDLDKIGAGGYIAEYVVPEPSTILLLASGFIGIGIIGYRRRKNS